MTKRKDNTSNINKIMQDASYKVDYNALNDDNFEDLYLNDDNDNNELQTKTSSITGSKVKNPYPVTMSLHDEDNDRNKAKADLFNRLYKLKCKRGIAKYNNVEEMSLVIDNYFHDCAEFSIRPTIRGLADALGTGYNTLNDWENGSRDKSLGSQCSAVIKKAKAFIAEFDEQMAIEGLDNPVLFMFRAKNYYGMQDKKDISVTPTNSDFETRSIEDIMQDIPDNIPIDDD